MSKDIILKTLNLFDEAEQEYSLPLQNPIKEDTIVQERKSKSKTEEIFKGVPVREVLVELGPEEQLCTKCHTSLEQIGKEYIRQKFRFIPAKGELVKIYRATYKCQKCSTQNLLGINVQFVKAHVLEALIPHSYATASVVGWLMYQKYVNSMPLYRQEHDWKQLGVQFTSNVIYLRNFCYICQYSFFYP